VLLLASNKATEVFLVILATYHLSSTSVSAPGLFKLKFFLF